MVTVFSSPDCAGHTVPHGFPERPERLAGILAHLAAAGRTIEEIAGLAPGGEPGAPPVPNPAVRAAVLAVHDEGYVERFARASARGDGLLDSADNPLSAGSWAAAWGAAAATLAAADRAAAGAPAFAAVRPPGHHAERALAMGFCFFNNAAVAAQHLRSHHGAARVAVFDFDVHHGNGTQHLFERRADIFYASTHQYPFYPGTGAASETGVGEGAGATFNVPLPAGSGDDVYEEAIRGRVIPALRDFAPEVLVVSAGFDAWQGDPLGGMRVSAEGFAQWGVWLRELAEEICGGRLLAVLEGGYDLRNLPALVEGHLCGLEGRDPVAEER
jgi:acetoin utilization deacetylase AcuC-like enzyme